ncbi:MAG TPA: DUF167 domain-containing protein [Candidatus Paceibacterota bacterium]|nr:DUF167 domain-containing protein [Candidatus Paceibacterota bacterium]
MKILVRAKPGAKAPRIEEITGLFEAKGERQFVIAVKEPAKEGKANRAIERALSEYFNVPVSQIRIVSGETRRDKVVEIG